MSLELTVQRVRVYVNAMQLSMRPVFTAIETKEREEQIY